MRIAVFYETWTGHAGQVAGRIAETLRRAGHDVAVKRCREARSEDLARAEAVLVGASVRVGKHHPKAVSFARANRGILASKPSAFFSVSLSARRKTPQEAEDLERILARFAADTGWEPARRAAFAGGLHYTKYNFLLRWLMRKISASQGNDVDVTRDHVYTDWEAVDRFAEEFAAQGHPEPAAR